MILDQADRPQASRDPAQRYVNLFMLATAAGMAYLAFTQRPAPAPAPALAPAAPCKPCSPCPGGVCPAPYPPLDVTYLDYGCPWCGRHVPLWSPKASSLLLGRVCPGCGNRLSFYPSPEPTAKVKPDAAPRRTGPAPS